MDAAVPVNPGLFRNPEYGDKLLQRNENCTRNVLAGNIPSSEVIHAITEIVVITFSNETYNNKENFSHFVRHILRFPQSSSRRM